MKSRWLPKQYVSNAVQGMALEAWDSTTMESSVTHLASIKIARTVLMFEKETLKNVTLNWGKQRFKLQSSQSE